MDTRRNPEKRFVLPPPASATLFSLRHCAAMGLWEEGMEVAAQIIEPDSLERREGAGRFYLALMHALTATGDRDGAEHAWQLLCRIWPEGKRLLSAQYPPQ